MRSSLEGLFDSLTNNARNKDTRVTQIGTTPHCSDANTDPSTTTPAATHTDDVPSQSSTMVDGLTNSS